MLFPETANTRSTCFCGTKDVGLSEISGGVGLGLLVLGDGDGVLENSLDTRFFGRFGPMRDTICGLLRDGKSISRFAECAELDELALESSGQKTKLPCYTFLIIY